MLVWTDRQADAHLHHNLPITMTSTTSPLCSSTYCSVLGGSISRPLALRMDISLLDTWLPADRCSPACGTRLQPFCPTPLGAAALLRVRAGAGVLTCALGPGQRLLVVPGENAAMVLRPRIQLHVTRQLEVTELHLASTASLQRPSTRVPQTVHATVGFSERLHQSDGCSSQARERKHKQN